MRVARAFRLGVVGTALFVGAQSAMAFTPDRVQLRLISNVQTGVFDDGAAEITAYDPGSQRLFYVNANAVTVDILDLSDPVAPTFISSIDVTDQGDGANSVDVYDGLVAVAVEGATATSTGVVAFYDVDGTFLNSVTVGVLPDMLTFSPDGTRVLTANEGQPTDDYSSDPVGSVSIVDLSAGVAAATVTTAGFGAWDGKEDSLRAAGVRIFGPGSSASQDFEPEYIALSADGATAWVALQENNAFAVVDVDAGVITDILPMGFKDHSLTGNGLDASNRDDSINIATWPVLGMFMPDAIASYEVDGATYIVSANEGDSRDYDGYSEEERVADLTLDPGSFPNAANLQDDANLGRLKTTSANGDTDGDGDFDVIYSYGARSFSIWSEDGSLVFDSGDDFEQRLADLVPGDFNSTNDENDSFDNRSDDKGPEPEGVTIGWISGRAYAFIGLERVGGIMVYDITEPTSPSFVTYVTHRDFSVLFDPDTVTAAELTAAGDLGPEGLAFISADDSPNGSDLLVVANEVSGSISIYEVSAVQGLVRGDAEIARVPTRTALAVTVTALGSPVTGLTLELSRAIAGRQRDYVWSATTDADGDALIAVDGDRVAGYYQLRARDASGAVIGTWGSIPLNGGLQTNALLTFGKAAFIESYQPLPAAKIAASTPSDPQLGNFPNPFNPTTHIRYTLSQPGDVSLTVYNTAGQQVRTLVQGMQPQGSYEVPWDGRDGAGRDVSSGVYYYRLTLPSNETVTRAMSLIR